MLRPSGPAFLLDLFAQSLCLPSMIPIGAGFTAPSVAGKNLQRNYFPPTCWETAEGRQTTTYFTAGEGVVFSGAMKPW